VTTFVLVHGAWHGGWCWQHVSRALRAAGHDVLTPTLTGLGERSHLLTPEVDLRTHVRDVTAVLEYEDLTDVVLVGHSYAGMVVPGVAAQQPDRLRRVVVLDGFLPERGEEALALLPPEAAAHYRELAVDPGEGWWVPPRPMDWFGVTDPVAEQWLSRRLVRHPLKTYTQPAAHGASDLTVPAGYILCAGWATRFRPMAARATELGWPVTELAADHEVMATDPMALVGELLAQKHTRSSTTTS
jgi:pimeloyl-ACP methyl ester carboxylesterase